MLQCPTAQLLGVLNGLTTFSGIDYVGVLSTLDAIKNVRTPFMYLIHQTWVDAGLTQDHGGAVGSIQLKTGFNKLGSQINNPLLVAITNRQQYST